MKGSDFSPAAIRGDDRGYIAFHSPRFAYLLGLLEDLGVDQRARILDIGRSRLTDLVRARFSASVDSLGFQDDSVHENGNHYRFDLNDCQRQETWRRDLPTYDVIIMAE